MMKKRAAAICLTGILIVGILSGCVKVKVSFSKKDDKNQVSSEQTGNDDSQDAAADGSKYDIPDGWVIAEQMSTENKKFYVEEGHASDSQPDNFSMEYGTNRYAAAEHERFRDAIMQQLARQTAQYGATVEGSGKKTDNGDIFYIFRIDYEEAVATQIYIVGERSYCFIFATDFTGNSTAADAALAVAKSFRWE